MFSRIPPTLMYLSCYIHFGSDVSGILLVYLDWFMLNQPPSHNPWWSDSRFSLNQDPCTCTFTGLLNGPGCFISIVLAGSCKGLSHQVLIVPVALLLHIQLALTSCWRVIVNKLHRKNVVGRWSADHLPTTYRPPTNHLPTTYRPPKILSCRGGFHVIFFIHIGCFLCYDRKMP